MIKFIQTFDPCNAPCLTVVLGCSADLWQDGVCQDRCNVEECEYDGGDCNQFCDCDYNLWMNDKCDDTCNTTQCNWDFYQCVEADEVNETCNIVVVNEWNDDTNNDSDNYSIHCYKSWVDDTWIDDTWCDASCNVEMCDYDSGLCDECADDSQCGQLLFFLNAMRSDEENIYGNDLLTKQRACQYFGTLVFLFDEYDQSDNCSDVFDVVDINGNGFIGWYEILQQFAVTLGITQHIHWQEKVDQIDCSACLDNVSYYYW